MPGQNLRLYDIPLKVNERADGDPPSLRFHFQRRRTDHRALSRLPAGSDPLQFSSGLLSLFELFFGFVGRIYDGWR